MAPRVMARGVFFALDTGLIYRWKSRRNASLAPLIGVRPASFRCRKLKRAIIQHHLLPRVHMLDFRSLQLATASLAEALEAAKLRPDDAFVRDASIQRFEVTYERSVKSLRRQLEAMADSPAELDALGYRDMIRVGVERGLIAAEAEWFRYRELRNITAHVYDPAKAAQVFAKLPLFLRDAQALLGKLVAANA